MEDFKYFGPFNLNETGREKTRRMTVLFERLEQDLKELMGLHPRCNALAMTRLEEACYYAKKSVAVMPENQTVEGT